MDTIAVDALPTDQKVEAMTLLRHIIGMLGRLPVPARLAVGRDVLAYLQFNALHEPPCSTNEETRRTIGAAMRLYLFSLDEEVQTHLRDWTADHAALLAAVEDDKLSHMPVTGRPS